MRVEGNDQRLAAATATQMQMTGTQKSAATVSTQEHHDQDHAESVRSIAGDKVTIKIELPRNALDTLQKMGNISDFLNSVATNLRQTNEGLTESSKVMEDMKASLDKILNAVPPYSLRSKERLDQLMSYTSLKKQIMSLMVPPPPPPIYEKVQHLWDDLFSGPNSTIQTPTLPEDVPDSHIKAAAGQLNSISEQVALLQDALGKSITRG